MQEEIGRRREVPEEEISEEEIRKAEKEEYERAFEYLDSLPKELTDGLAIQGFKKSIEGYKSHLSPTPEEAIRKAQEGLPSHLKAGWEAKKSELLINFPDGHQLSLGKLDGKEFTDKEIEERLKAVEEQLKDKKIEVETGYSAFMPMPPPEASEWIKKGKRERLTKIIKMEKGEK